MSQSMMFESIRGGFVLRHDPWLVARLVEMKRRDAGEIVELSPAPRRPKPPQRDANGGTRGQKGLV